MEEEYIEYLKQQNAVVREDARQLQIRLDNSAQRERDLYMAVGCLREAVGQLWCLCDAINGNDIGNDKIESILTNLEPVVQKANELLGTKTT